MFLKELKLLRTICSWDSMCLSRLTQFTSADLPLAHIMERVALGFYSSNGALSCFIASGDIKKYFFEDLAMIRPTSLSSPRILTLIHQRILASFSELMSDYKVRLEEAISIKRRNFISTGVFTHSEIDSLILKNASKIVGDRLTYITIGSAPLSKIIADDLKIFLSVPILEGYGNYRCVSDDETRRSIH